MKEKRKGENSWKYKWAKFSIKYISGYLLTLSLLKYILFIITNNKIIRIKLFTLPLINISILTPLLLLYSFLNAAKISKIQPTYNSIVKSVFYLLLLMFCYLLLASIHTYINNKNIYTHANFKKIFLYLYRKYKVKYAEI